MSEGRAGSNVTRLQEVRRRRALRRLRRLVLVLAAAGLVALYFTGTYSQLALAARETFDSVRIALSPGAGWPVKTGIPEVWQAEPLSGGFVLPIFPRNGRPANRVLLVRKHSLCVGRPPYNLHPTPFCFSCQ